METELVWVILRRNRAGSGNNRGRPWYASGIC